MPNTYTATISLRPFSTFRFCSVWRKSIWTIPFLAVAMVGDASAAPLTWDAGGTHPTAPVDGSGTWDNVTANFSNGTTDVVGPVAPLTTTTTAITNSGGNTLTLASVAGLSAGEILSSPAFANGTTILSIAGNVVTLSANSTAAVAASTSISFAAAGSTVTFGANNGAAGIITVAAGGEGANALVLNPATSGNYTFTGGAITVVSSGAGNTSSLTVKSGATFNNNLNIAGTSSGMMFTAAGQTLNLNGTGANSVGNTISGSTAAIGAASALTLGGGGTYSGSGANTAVVINIGTAGALGTNPGLTTPTTGVIVNSGTFVTGATTTIGLTNNNGLLTVNGGAFTQGQFLAIGQSEGATNVARLVINSGTATVGQVLMNYNGGLGGSELDINGGTFTTSNALTGYVALQAGSLGGQSILNITGGTANISGLLLNGGQTGGGATGGNSTLSLSGGTLYLGLGGLTNGGVGAATYTINLGGGTLAASANWISALNMNLGASTTTTIQTANASAVAENIALLGTLSGTGNIVKTGAGTLTLGGANSYSGTTAINAGTLQFAKEASFYSGVVSSGTAAQVSVTSGGTLGLNVGGTGEFTLADVSTIAGNSNWASGSVLGLDTTNAGGNFTLSSSLSGSYGLTKSGAGTLTVTGTNSYTGPTTVNGGTLDLGGSTGTGSISSSSALVLAGGTFNYTRSGGSTQTFNGLTLNQGASSVKTVAGNTVALGAITRNAGSTVNFGNTGTLTTTTSNDARGILGGYATYNGTDWAVNNGTSIAAYSGYTQTSTALNVPANYAAKNIDVNSSQSPTAAIAPNTLRFNTNAAETLTLTGINALADGGILVTSAVGAFTSTITGGTLEGSSGGNLIVNQYNTSGGLTIGSIIANNGTATGLVKSGDGTLTLSAANTYTGATILNAGVVVLNNANALNSAALSGGISFDGGTLQYGTATTDYSSAIKNSTNAITIDLNSKAVTWTTALSATNTGGVIIEDSSVAHTGALTLSANGNAISGNLTILSGKVTMGAGGFNATNVISVASGGVLDLNAFGQTIGGLNGGTGTVTNGGATAKLTIGGSGSYSFGGVLTASTPANLSVTMAGNGIQVLTGANTYTGVTTISEGILSTDLLANGGTASGIGQSSNAAANLVVNGGTLQYTGAGAVIDRLFTIGGALVGGAGTIDASGSGALNFNNAGSLAYGTNNQARILNLTGSSTAANTLSPIIANNGTGVTTLNKSGSGTWVLAGANTFTGGTTVNGGKLQLMSAVTSTTSSTGTGIVTESGGLTTTLSGTGGAKGLVTVTNGSRIAPGVNVSGTNTNFGAAGSLALGTTGGLILTDAHLDFDLSTSAASGNDILTTGSLTLGTLVFTFDGLGSTLDTSSAYTLIDGASVSGFNALNISTVYVGPINGLYTATYSINGTNDLVVNFSAAIVPEPNTWAMMLGGLAALILVQHRRKKV